MVKNLKNKSRNRVSFWRRVWNIICWPFKKIWAGICALWKWIAGINLVALLNLALLVSIIVLFSLLIIDLRKGANANSNVAQKPVVEQVEQPKAEQKPVVKPRRVTALPVKHNAQRKALAMPIRVAKVKQNPTAIKQVAVIVKTKTVYGDTVIDHHDMTSVLPNGAHITGNLYIQDLRKYTLPCNVVIDGNLILRDVNMLNFCGDFTVRGNIYVSPRSSFGPIPSTARVGGQVIL